MITHVQIAVNGKMTYRKAIPAGAVVITDFSIEMQTKSLLIQWLLRADTYL
jgi:outer membrane usher protein FimD/PapC